MPSRIIEVSQNLWFVNVGVPSSRKLAEHQQGIRYHSLRRWDNSKDFGFISAGQGPSWIEQIRKVKENDIVCAFVTEKGFVGIGKCLKRAIMITQFQTSRNEFLSNVRLIQPTNILTNNAHQKTLSEYAIQVGWYKGLTVDLENAYSIVGLNLGITQHIVTDLKNGVQAKVEFIENSFGVKFKWAGRRFNN